MFSQPCVKCFTTTLPERPLPPGFWNGLLEGAPCLCLYVWCALCASKTDMAYEHYAIASIAESCSASARDLLQKLVICHKWGQKALQAGRRALCTVQLYGVQAQHSVAAGEQALAETPSFHTQPASWCLATTGTCLCTISLQLPCCSQTRHGTGRL